MLVSKKDEKHLAVDTGKVLLEVEDGVFSFTSSRDTSVGWKKFICETRTAEGTVYTSEHQASIKRVEKTVDQLGEGKTVTIGYSSGGLEENITLTIHKDYPVLFLEHDVTNKRDAPFGITQTSDVVLLPGGAIEAGEDPLFFSTENVRFYTLFADFTTRDKVCLPFPSEPVTVGHSEDFPFTGIFFGSRRGKRSLVDAVLTEEKRIRVRKFEARNPREITNFRGEFWARGLDFIRLEPGETLKGETVYLEIADTIDLSHVFDNYVETLKRNYRFYAPTSTNRYEMTWGYCNEGIYLYVTGEIVLRNARWVKKNFPSVRWIQIDAGYAKASQLMGAGSAYFYGDIDANIDTEKFPAGMKKLAQEIKRIGLRPAIWVGLGVNDSSAVFKEHPDWFLMDRRGGHMMLKGQVNIEPDPAKEPVMVPNNSVFYDLSVPEVRSYLYHGFEKVIRDWGFAGVKLDFWSYNTETAEAVPRNKDKTLLEWRKWLLGMIRSLLPQDGYFQAGCTIPLGSPFLGLYFDNYRYGWDIGDGNWAHIVESAKWLTPVMLFSTSDLAIVNGDSVSTMSGLGELEKYTWYNFCLASRTLVETAGDLSRCKDKKALSDLKKVVAAPSNGEKVYFADLNERGGPMPPAIWYFCGSASTRDRGRPGTAIRCAGVFNWGERKRAFTIRMKSLRLDSKRAYRIENFWSGKSKRVKDKLTFELRPHESVLLEVYE